MDELIKALKEKLGEDIISEELIDELTASLEIMVNEKVKEVITVKEAELVEKSETEMTEFKDSLIESLDKYIEYASDEYLKENEVALETGAKVLAAEKIIEATKDVFKEVGFEIPDTEVDVVKQLETDLEESTTKLNESINEVIEAKKQMFEFEKAVKFQNLTSDLTESKIEEVHTLLEGLEYKNITDFEKKVKIVKKKLVEKLDDKNDEELDDLTEDEEKESSIDKYLI